MGTIRFGCSHTLADLERDLLRMPGTAARGMSSAVRDRTRQGERVSKGFARAASGPHGSAYFKRITSEMTSPLSGEFGPHGDVSKSVGGGWRNGPPNTDTEKAGDIVGPALAKDMEKLLGRLFW